MGVSTRWPAVGPGLTPSVQVLHPGDVAIGERGDRFQTLLGSCIAIVLTDPRRTIGAMCHIVHSTAGAGAMADTAHAEPALESMFELLRGRGINPLMCQAWVFGGGNMFPELFRHHHVGRQNAQWAFDMLDELGVHRLGDDVGGTTYRRITWTVGPDAPRVDAVDV
jgi:chemotaxis protein CheD